MGARGLSASQCIFGTYYSKAWWEVSCKSWGGRRLGVRWACLYVRSCWLEKFLNISLNRICTGIFFYSRSRNKFKRKKKGVVEVGVRGWFKQNTRINRKKNCNTYNNFWFLLCITSLVLKKEKKRKILLMDSINIYTLYWYLQLLVKNWNNMDKTKQQHEEIFKLSQLESQ